MIKKRRQAQTVNVKGKKDNGQNTLTRQQGIMFVEQLRRVSSSHSLFQPAETKISDTREDNEKAKKNSTGFNTCEAYFFDRLVCAVY